jgi:ABC-type uncharacterized transport system substrate-binding protein
MRRRELLGFMGAAVAAPPPARMQQKAMPVVGLLASHNLGSSPFEQGLRDAGFVTDESVALVYRFTGDLYDELPNMAADLVRRKVDVIAAFGITEAVAARRATDTIPIVAWAEADPVAAGLAASLARPGGNVTGVLTMDAELMPKRLQLLSQLVPEGKVFALLVNPKAAFTPAVIRRAQAGAGAMGVKLDILQVGTDDEIAGAFATLGRLKPDGLIVDGDKLLQTRAVDGRLVRLTARDRVPAIYVWSVIAWTGGLITYGASREAVKRQMGVYAGRILKGAKPADLPFDRAAKFELFINMKTAKALGINVPQSLLAQADKVIQ